MCGNPCSSGPDLTFGPPTAGSAVDSLQWHDSASPPAVQPENASIAKSPLRSECGTAAKGKIDASNLRTEFVPGVARLAQPTLEKVQVGVKSSEYMPADERWSGPNSGAQLIASDCLQDGEVSGIPDPYRPSVLKHLHYPLLCLMLMELGLVARDRTGL